MRKEHFQIAVAISAGIFFLTVTIAHACIVPVGPHSSRDHSGMQAATGLMQTSHGEAQDESCRSLRDRLISLAPEPSQFHLLVSDVGITPAIGEQVVAEIHMFTAERPPGSNSIADDQPPLYIFNSVFRI